MNNKQEIDDLLDLYNNPPARLPKPYNTVEKYRAMLKYKIAKLSGNAGNIYDLTRSINKDMNTIKEGANDGANKKTKHGASWQKHRNKKESKEYNRKVRNQGKKEIEKSVKEESCNFDKYVEDILKQYEI